MANTIQFKRGLEADRSSVTPAAGEILYTTDTKLVYIGDGSTAGGNLVSSSGGATIEATASGALANGDLVAVNSDGTVSEVSTITLTATNFIGISDGAYADTATATIQITGAVDDAQTGLTAGSQYYVQTDGTLSTTAGSPSVLAGTALSSTNLLVRG
jgi:hypothetical protein